MAVEHDVFVSYAHDDNEVPLGTTSLVGWVTTLARNLNIGPGVYKKNLFIDDRLKPGDAFSDELMRKVEGSRVLVVLLSQNYIDSKWCGVELDRFIRTHSNDPDAPPDVFIVELTPFESLDRVPSNIQNVRKGLIHAKFWQLPQDAASPILAGYPTPEASGCEQQYWLELNELRTAIDTRLRRLDAARLGNATAPVTSAQAASGPSHERLGTVLLADVTEDLESRRAAVKAALEPEGVVVVPAGDYVGLTPRELDIAIAQDLDRSEVFIQLLSPTPGRPMRGTGARLPQLQFQRAAAAKLPVMQWCEALPGPDLITDTAHRTLFETEFIRATTLTAFQNEVIEFLKAKRQNERAHEAPAPPIQRTSAAARKLIFVDDIGGNGPLGEKLRTIIKGANCDIRSLPAAAPLGGDGVDVREALRTCRGGITVYTDRSKFATVYNRLVFFLNQIAEARLSLARWGVWLEGGTVASIFGIESDDVVTLSESHLPAFLQGL